MLTHLPICLSISTACCLFCTRPPDRRYKSMIQYFSSKIKRIL